MKQINQKIMTNINTNEDLIDFINDKVVLGILTLQDVYNKHYIDFNNGKISKTEINFGFEIKEIIVNAVTFIIGGNKNQKIIVKRELLFNERLNHSVLNHFAIFVQDSGVLAITYVEESNETEEFMELVNYLKRQ